MREAITKAGYKPGSIEDGGDVTIALDVAASEFFEGGKYHLKKMAKGL